MQTVGAAGGDLVNIVKGVAAHRTNGWSPDELAQMKSSGIHSTAWKAR